MNTMYMIEITEDKVESLKENAEKMLRYGGKVMQCLDELSNDSRSGERHGDYMDYREMTRGRDRDGDGRYGERWYGGRRY